MGPLGTPLDGNERYIVFSMVGEDDALTHQLWIWGQETQTN